MQDKVIGAVRRYQERVAELEEWLNKLLRERESLIDCFEQHNAYDPAKTTGAMFVEVCNKYESKLDTLRRQPFQTKGQLGFRE